MYFQDIDSLNNESQKFAEKHGFDLTRLEYVRQLAIDGVEGDFSFREFENDSVVSSLYDQILVELITVVIFSKIILITLLK